MQSEAGNRHEEAAILTQGVETLLRRLIRFLIGKMSLVKLQEIIRFIFVEEIENKLRLENPEKSIPLTQLALLSGLDTRTLTKIRNSDQFRRPFHQAEAFLRDSAPGAAILDIWSSRAPYIDTSSGKPRALPINGKSPSFESLFEDFGKTRGITHKSLLRRLIESGAVEQDEESEVVRLISRSYLPSGAKDRLGAIEMGFLAIGSMIDTVARNITALDEDTERFYQRGAWTYRLNRQDRIDLREKLRDLLEETDLRARRIIESHEEGFVSDEQVTAGISMFYFEETMH